MVLVKREQVEILYGLNVNVRVNIGHEADLNAQIVYGLDELGRVDEIVELWIQVVVHEQRARVGRTLRTCLANVSQLVVDLLDLFHVGLQHFEQIARRRQLVALQLVHGIGKLVELVRETVLCVAHNTVSVFQLLLDLVAQLVELLLEQDGYGAHVGIQVLFDQIVHLSDRLLHVVELLASFVQIGQLIPYSFDQLLVVKLCFF